MVMGSIKRALGAMLIGILGGAFVGFLAILTVAPSDPLIWLGALGVGAVFGACMAVWVILQSRGVAIDRDEITKTR